MAYRSFTGRRGGGDGGTGLSFPWPYVNPHYVVPSTPRYNFQDDRPTEGWDSRAYSRQYQPAHGQWNYVTPVPQVNSFSSSSTPSRYTRASPVVGTWKQRRLAGATGAGFQADRRTSSPPGNVIMPLEHAMKRLFQNLSTCQRLCDDYRCIFRTYAGQLCSRVKEDTLDLVWRDLIASGNSDRFGEIVRKTKQRMSDLRAVLTATQSTSAFDQDPEVSERRGRVATKALLHCDQLEELFSRAKLERRACKLLIEELSQVTTTLDPTRNANLYRDAEEEVSSRSRNSAGESGGWDRTGNGTDNWNEVGDEETSGQSPNGHVGNDGGHGDNNQEAQIHGGDDNAWD